MNATPPEHHPHDLKRSLNVRDMTLFTVSGILLMDALAASASIGVSSLSWWIIMGVVFSIPYGLISSEMGTTYPEQGGIYVWVPGGNRVALLMTALCIGLILFTILLFMYVPGEEIIWPVAIGTGLSVVLGEVAIRYSEYEIRKRGGNNCGDILAKNAGSSPSVAASRR